jgi:hypothetical protein
MSMLIPYLESIFEPYSIKFLIFIQFQVEKFILNFRLRIHALIFHWFMATSTPIQSEEVLHGVHVIDEM